MRSKCQVFGQDQDALHRLAQIDLCLGAKENSLRANVAGLPKKNLGSFSGRDLHQHFERKSRQLSPFWMLRHLSNPRKRQIFEISQTSIKSSNRGGVARGLPS